MKAKMPQKPAEAGRYLCIWCDSTFIYEAGHLRCPNCGNSLHSDIVAIYIEENPLEETLYTADDWHGG